MAKRIFVSSRASVLDERRQRLKAAVLGKIRQAGYEQQEFGESGIAERLAWSFENVERVMRQCVGAVVFGFTRWTISDGTKLLSEYNHYEGAVALTHCLPVLLLKEGGVDDRGVVWSGGGKTVTHVPRTADATWVESKAFTKQFNAWLRELGERRDVFLGYCSKSDGIAAHIEVQLQRLGASVLDWAMDFRAGSSILNEIENARNACSCGVFLFSEDDPLEGTSGVAAPRDNVVFEAGYFMSAKGPEKCLIIRHGDAKMPADVGGAIYVHLGKGADVSSIDRRLSDFVARNL